ncbi:sensor histidine kinase [Paenibacillus sp. GCM10027626]|uniref:sensor histidine kinase n=1 Tax=Paenibacillus sp. GCM10027626 TaxID=3273411 RepID=UPI003629C83E
MSIRSKLFITNTIVVLLLLGSLTFFMTDYSNNIIFKKIEENSRYSVSQLSQNFDNLLQSYEQVMDFLYTNEYLQDRLMASYDSFPEAQKMYFETVDPLLRSVRGSKEVIQFTFYTENPMLEFAGFQKITDAVKASPWYKAYHTNPKAVRLWWPVVYDPFKKIGTISLTQRLNNLSPNAELYVTLEVDVRLLYNLIASENRDNRFIAALPDGSILMDSHNRGGFGDNLNREWFADKLAGQDSGSVFVENEGRSYLLVYQTLQSRSSLRGIKVMSLIPADSLLENANELKRVAIILLITAVLVTMIVIYIISQRLTKGLMVLASGMKSVNMEQLKPIAEIKGNDEVSALGYIFNGMIARMSRLITEVYQSEINNKELELKTRESELYALQTQINPHYLYNTLNAIRGNLLEKGDKQNAEMVKLLAQSFRNVLNKGGQMITLNEELDIIDTYLKIQSFRFAERLVYTIHISKELQHYKIPRLSLQTLVENAIVHALEKNEGQTVITIRADIVDADTYCIYVEDNGLGMSPERLAEVQEWLNDVTDAAGEKHIGLRNIQQRLQHIYGAKYGLRVESALGAGTKAILLLPVSE